LLLHGVKSNMGVLKNGEPVLVPTIGPQVTVEGMVRRPAIYELKDEKNLAQCASELAGACCRLHIASHRSAAAFSARKANNVELRSSRSG